jgi:RNA:NAD 2'-phosphotransferase (TPT1/KptA family)
MDKGLVKLSKFIGLVLRAKPEEIGLELMRTAGRMSPN